MMGENQVVDHSHKSLQLSKVLWGSRVGDGVNFEVVSSLSIRGSCKPPKRCLVYFKLELVWVKRYMIIPCCVKDAEYVLIMLL